MTTAQKVIKIFAYCLAAILSLWIFGGILALIGLLGGVAYLNDSSRPNDEVSIEVSLGEAETQIENMKVSLQASRFTLKAEGDEYRIETNVEDRYKFEQNDDKIVLIEKDWQWISLDGMAEITLYIPEDAKLNAVDIDLGAGTANIQKIDANVVDLDFGAGKAVINELIVRERADIDGGAGMIEVLGGYISNLDFDLGVGKTVMSATLVGRSEISGGVGSFELNLTNLEEQTFRVNKGIGSIKISGQDMADNSELGSGANYMHVSGGVGSITIN